jgi:hypothetical protein
MEVACSYEMLVDISRIRRWNSIHWSSIILFIHNIIQTLFGSPMRPMSDHKEWQGRRLRQSLAASLPDIFKFLMGVHKLWVFFRELLVSFEGNSVSSDFDKLLEMNTVGVPDITRLRVLLGILLNFSAPHLRIMFLLACTFLLFYALTRTNPTYEGSRESWWPVVN